MKKIFSRALPLALIVILLMGTSATALPIQPLGSDRLDHLDFIIGVIQEYYVDEVDTNILIEGAFRGVFNELDPYSRYFSPEEYQRYNEDAGGTFGGVGITVTKDEETDFIKVIAPIEGTPGDRADIKTNDLIIAVNGNSIQGYTLEEAVEVMRGEPGTKLNLTLKREGIIQPIEVDIIREIIEVNPVRFEIRDDGIVNLRLKSFNEHSAKDVREALEIIKSDTSVKGIIIDLRNNPGGRLDQVVDIADMFLDIGEPIVQVDYRATPDNVFNSKQDPLVKLPLAVLINEGSASASEILAGALQDNEIARVIGQTSFGKGTVQSVLDLSNGGGIKLTIAEYLTADGNKVNGVGISPDVEISRELNGSLKSNADFAPMIEDEVSGAGDVGLNVYGAQQRLIYLGYTVDPTGTYDDLTQEAVLEFQKIRNLPLSGLLDVETRNALYKRVDDIANGEEDLVFDQAVELLLK